MGRLTLLGAGHNFSLASFMANQADGLWYDFTKTDRLFQENVGPTPAQETNDAIGLALDQRTWGGKTLAQMIAAAPELLVPGSWAMSVAGGTSTATESPAGSLNFQADGTNQARGDQSFATVVGKVYRVVATASAAATPNLFVGTTQSGTSILNVTVSAGTTKEFYFTATSTTTWVRFARTGTSASPCVVSGASCKLVSNYAATQSSSTLKPTFQTTGAKFDGSDDNLLTGYLAGAGANFIVARVTVPASISANQVIAGASGGATGRTFVSIDTAGRPSGGVGNNGVGVIVGASDLRNSEAIIGVSYDGNNVRLFANAAQEYTGAQSGTPITSVGYAIGATGAAGGSSSFFGGAVKRIVAGREFLSLTRYQQIRSELLSA